MKLNRQFYDAAINFRNISKERWILAIVIGLAFAFFMYSFFYVLRETYRVMSVAFANYPSYVSESHRRIYNIFFAGLSLIYGNSVAIGFILSSSQNVFSRLNLKKSRVFNDQIFLNCGFAHWFLKIMLVMGMFSVGMMDFDYLPFLYPVGLLMLLVFYLETWKTLLQVMGKKRYRWLLMHFISMCVLTYGLSFINIVDYKAIDAASLEWKPIIDIPESKLVSIENQSRQLQIDFKLRIKEGQLEIINNDGYRLTIDEVPNELINERTSSREELMDYLSVAIKADKNLTMKYILDFQSMVCKGGVYKLIYVVNDGSYFESRFQSKGIGVRGCVPYISNDKFFYDNRIPTIETEWYYDEMIKNLKSSSESKDRMEITIDEIIKINGQIVTDDMLVSKLKNGINKHTILIYNYSLKTLYKDYIKVLSAHFEAAYSIRNEKQTIKYDRYNDAYDIERGQAFKNEQDSLKQMFPILKIDRIN